MKRLAAIVTVRCIVVALCAVAPLPDGDHNRANYLLSPLASNFQRNKLPVTFWVDGTAADAEGRFAHSDTLNVVLPRHSDWMLVTVHNSTQCVHPTPLQSVVMASSYRFMTRFVLAMPYKCFHPSGYYIFSVAEHGLREQDISGVFEVLWKKRIVNAVFIAPLDGGTVFQAYGYAPYGPGNCGSVRLKQLDQYRRHRWQRPGGWFRAGALPNFHRCTLRVGTFESKPYVIKRNTTNGTATFVGLEVAIFQTIAAKLNFTYQFVTPAHNSKWGRLMACNSTGLMGMLQRSEVDVGFSSTGRSLNRDALLRCSFPSITTQLSMAIPPKRPYTSLEKLFQPLSLPAWLLVAGGYATIGGLYVLVFRARGHPYFEHIPGVFYAIWTILMGGPVSDVRRHSSRLFVISLVLNAFVVRNLYQSALFQHLKSTDTMAANLHTYEDINGARLSYYMYESTGRFFLENPAVNKTIRLLMDESIDWDGIMYDISQHRLKGVIALPLESITYYVKHHGSQGMVYASERTGISFFVAFYFPQMSALQEPFDYLLHRLHAGGLVDHSLENFRNNPHTWANYEQDSAPKPLQLHQVSGGFYVWAVCVALATVVFVGELMVSGPIRRGK